MAIYKKNSTDLEMYSGDTGNIKITGLPTDKNYNVYLEVIKPSTKATVFTLLVQTNQADNVTFSISEANSNLLTVTDIDTPETYYWSVKICDPQSGTEDTVIPKTTVDATSGLSTFSKPYKLIVRYKLVEGTTTNV